MKLRLPHKFQAALMAALASVSFTTLSIGTQAYAETGEITLTTTFTGANNANIADVGLTNTLSQRTATGVQITGDVTSLTNKNGDVNLQTSGTAGGDSAYFTPNTNVGNGTPWTAVFTYSNVADLTSLDSMALTYGLYNASGNTHSGSSWDGNLTFTATVTSGDKSAVYVGSFTNPTGDPAKQPVTLTLQSGQTALDLTDQKSFTVTLALSKTWADGKGTFVGIYDLSYNLHANLAGALTWAGTQADNDWSHAVWNDGSTPYVPGSTVIFTQAGYHTVAVTTAVTAGDVTIDGAAYTFTLSGSGSLAAKTLTVESGLSITGSGTATASTLDIASGKTVSIEAGAKLTVDSRTGSGKISGDGTFQLNQASAGNVTINADNFTGTFIFNEGNVSQHDTSIIADAGFAGTLEIRGRIRTGSTNFGNAKGIRFVADRSSNSTGVWSNSAATWDKPIEIAKATPEVSGAVVQFELSNTLTLTGALSGNGTLMTTNNSTLNIQGGGSIDTLYAKGGNNDARVNITGKELTLNHLYAGGGTTNIETTVNIGQLRLSENGISGVVVSVNDGGILNITGTNNDHSTGASMLLAHWNQTSTLRLNGGTINAADTEMHLSWDGTGTFAANSGTAYVKGIDGYGQTSRRGTFSLGAADSGSATVVLGSTGLKNMGDSVVLTLGQGTLGASANWTLSTDAGTAVNANFIGTGTGTIIDTTDAKDHATARTITFNNGTTGSGNMTVTGTGKLVLNGGGDRTGATTVQGGATLEVHNATALGTGAVTVNAGSTLDLQSAVTLGSLTLGNNTTLVFAGADMLTAGSLALGQDVTALTFNLNSIVPTGRGTITLATGTNAAADLSGVDVTLVWDTKPTYYTTDGVRQVGNSWVITLENEGRELIWNGGDGIWSSTEQPMWHTATQPSQTVAFNTGDSAIFEESNTPALAMLAEAVEAEKVTVQSGATVAIMANFGADAVSLSATDMEVGGDLSTGANVTAAEIVGNGEAATWTIGSGTTVTTGVLEVEEGAALAFSGEGTLTVGTITGDGTIAFSEGFRLEVTAITVAADKELALSGAVENTIAQSNLNPEGKLVLEDGYHLTISDQLAPGTAGQALNIRNNAKLGVSLSNADNILNMDAASSGDLYLNSGYISYRSVLGTQTLHMANGTQLWFGEKPDGAADEAVFTNNIVLDGNATVRVYGSSKHSSATISGDVSGAGHTLTKNDGNQNLTFTGNVTLGGLTTDSNAGGAIYFSGDSVSIDNITTSGSATIVFNGGSASIGTIVTQHGSTIQFSNKEGAESSSYSFDTFALGSNGTDAARWLVVDANVTVEGKKDTLTKGDVKATISNDWGIDGGGVKVDGILNLAGEISMDGPESNYIKGAGIINTTGLNLCNGSTTYIQDGITVNITSSVGIHRRNNNASLHFAEATLAALNNAEGSGADWTLQSGYEHVYLDDSTNGTTFKADANRTITLASAMEGSGKLVKAGEGTVVLTGANTYSGGTAINAGTLAVASNGTIGAVTIGENGTLRMDKGYTFNGTISGAGKMTYAGETAATLDFGGQDISGWTGSFENESSAAVTLNITRADGRVNAAIGSADGGIVNITSANDVYFDNVVYVQDMTHNNNHTTFVETNASTGLSGIITASGHVTTGRLVVGKTTNDAGSMFILSGGDAYLANGTTEHTYGAKVQGYGTFKLVGGATQTLTGDLTGDIGFHGTFWADGADSTLTLQSTIADNVTLKATNGGEIILKSAAKKAEVDNGTFDLQANVETLNVSGESNTLDMNGGSVANINLGGNLTANGDLTIHSGNTGTVVNAEAGKKLAVLGTANVDERVKFSAAQGKTVDVTNTGDNEAEYSLENDKMNVQAHTLEVIDNENGVTISNLLVVDEIVNTRGQVLTLDNVGDTLELLNMNITNSTAQVYTNLAKDTEATVSISDTLTAGGSTLLANLTMADGSMLDVNGGNTMALTLGSQFTIANGALVSLDEATLSAIEGLTAGQEVILIKALQENGHELTSNLQNGALASLYFNGVDAADYTMVVNANEIAIKKAGAIPEPTTGTLSLLALAALAARRRRK